MGWGAWYLELPTWVIKEAVPLDPPEHPLH